MIWAITMPTWGLSMEEGIIVGWRVAEGSPTAAGVELVEIETSKIANSLEAREAGVLRRQLAKPGQVVACGELIGIIATDAVAESEIDAFIANFPRPRPAAPQAGENASSDPSLLLELPLGRQLRCVERGQLGSVVVFLHGFGGDVQTWMFNQGRIAEHHRTFAFDLPGHGDSTKQVDSGSIEELASSVAYGIDHLELKRIHLVGHSLGAAVALALCQRRPERVASVSLLAPLAFGSHANQAYISDFTSAQRGRDVQRCLALLFAEPKAVRRDMIESVVRYKRLDGVTDALAKIAASALREPAPVEMSSGVKTLTNRLLVIRGMHDNIVSAGEMPPGVRSQILADSGHMPHMEEPDRVNELLLSHFAAADGVDMEAR
ncbi:MAG: alpha/beta hydrolase fold [Gammaproteobacteria bacterium]|nr:alpha/beta hydrolase fold [Gammaproteobacteria bacterium]